MPPASQVMSQQKSMASVLPRPARAPARICSQRGGDMNKSDLTEQLAKAMHLSVREATSIVNTILDTMTETLAKGDSIEIRGFGSFGVKSYEAYTGRNPKTGEQIAVQPKKLPFFKAGKGLRNQINRKNRP